MVSKHGYLCSQMQILKEEVEWTGYMEDSIVITLLKFGQVIQSFVILIISHFGKWEY